MKENDISAGYSNVFMIIVSLVLMYFNIILGFISLVISIVIIKQLLEAEKKQQQEMDSYLETFTMTMDFRTKQSISNFYMPLVMANNKGIIVWYNKRFSEIIGKKGLFGERIEDYIPEFNLQQMIQDEEGSITIDRFGDRVFEAKYYVNQGKELKDKNLMISFEDVTELLQIKQESQDTAPCLIAVQVDSLDEVISSTEENNRPRLNAEIENRLKAWAEKNKMAFRRTSSDKFLAVTTEGGLRNLEESKFRILDDIRSIDFDNTIPLSISMGIASYSGDLRDTQHIAESALDIALGRGGDQVALRRKDKYHFYGGVSKAIEKKTRVKARIVSYALKDLILESSDIMVMGHNYADLDAIGSALGVAEIARLLKKDAKIVLEKPNSSIDILYQRIISNPQYKDIFIGKSSARALIKPTTLLVIVDTHKPSLTEYPELVKMAEKIVIIDHHRRSEEFVENPVLVYHETYVSSTSEMVTELIQYIQEKPQVNPTVAEALLAGIQLDTKNFTFKTGVRTFEAAAFLRKYGADTVAVKTLFQGDMDTYITQLDAMSKAKIIDGVIAIAYFDERAKNPQLVASKVADELLNLKGIQASFVLAEDSTGEIQISARSLGKINVQVIMEKIGGGGHMETAATQLRDISMEDAIKKVEEQISIYLKEM